ncbi:MAG: translation initiation factor IF-1 [Patescibacteria group bacterium]
MPSNKSVLKEEGVVYEALRGLAFRVRLHNGLEILAHLAGRLKINHIKVIPGDRVIVELNSLDDKRGRIIRRL